MKRVSLFWCPILFSDAIYYLSVVDSAVIGYILTAHVSGRCTCTAERGMWTEKICRRRACALWRFDWILCSTHLMGSREISHINLFIQFQSKIIILGRASNPINYRMSWWIYVVDLNLWTRSGCCIIIAAIKLILWEPGLISGLIIITVLKLAHQPVDGNRAALLLRWSVECGDRATSNYKFLHKYGRVDDSTNLWGKHGLIDSIIVLRVRDRCFSAKDCRICTDIFFICGCAI